MADKNWRDIDLARDRSVKTERKKSALEQRAEKKASSEAKKELEKLFKGSKLNKEKEAELESIRALRGRAEFYTAIEKYLSKFGIPREWEVQNLFLDHRDAKVVIQVLHEMLQTAPKAEISQQQLIGQKLKVLEVSTFDRELRDKIKEVKAALLMK